MKLSEVIRIMKHTLEVDGDLEIELVTEGDWEDANWVEVANGKFVIGSGDYRDIELERMMYAAQLEDYQRTVRKRDEELEERYPGLLP